MRYEKADNLLQLALDMQAARGGLTLADIEERYGCGRRTAMRMRDAVLRNFPQAEEVPTDERIKRWRIPPGILDRLIAFGPEELADLEAAVTLFGRENLPDRAASLAGLAAKLKALMRPDVARKVEPDLEALLEAEGLAMRPGPRPRIDLGVVEDLRQAIKACRKVALQYRNRRNGKLNRRILRPYGFLLGHRHYLIGWHEHPKANHMAPFALPNIEDVEILEESFERDPDFSLGDYAERSFGLYQEEPFDVVWRFTADAADNARDFVFHPKQEMEEGEDGSLIVRFRAGGDLEMAWHLYCWGDQVEVLEPQRLVEMVHKHRPHWQGLP
jgi:predicted DNA-binding transcriptional regulator YafY